MFSPTSQPNPWNDPRVKAIEYFETGMIKRVEFHPPVPASPPIPIPGPLPSAVVTPQPVPVPPASRRPIDPGQPYGPITFPVIEPKWPFIDPITLNTGGILEGQSVLTSGGMVEMQDALKPGTVVH
ncbi:hypothetical protein P0E64_14070 [Enterococcus faecalis]|uniref:hypothetical protein n=1 Tax=Enterococcus faecalis TaxID=1351 RepID=UPI0025B01311|nr:hypothetical protein [Enterococcus faecalis]MDN3126248.1 hypothetical protein [Enterococcus faecalis]